MEPLKEAPSASVVLVLLTIAIIATLALLAPDRAAAAAPCSARSGATVPAIIELYTSEGCDTCPPADRWLSVVRGLDSVVTLAFHVDYWDTRDWKDRFAKPQFARRQSAIRHISGARFLYTPQVILNGRDEPHWNRLQATALKANTAAKLEMTLTHDDAGLELKLAPGLGAPANMSGYVAVVDDGMQIRVDAGENRGATLKEDSVVRELLPWNLAGTEPATLRFSSSTAPERGATRRWVAVATDGPYGTPVQAVSLACTR